MVKQQGSGMPGTNSSPDSSTYCLNHSALPALCTLKNRSGQLLQAAPLMGMASRLAVTLGPQSKGLNGERVSADSSPTRPHLHASGLRGGRAALAFRE